MPEKRRGLGRGIGALIPSNKEAKQSVQRPMDVFFGSSAVETKANDDTASIAQSSEKTVKKQKTDKKRVSVPMDVLGVKNVSRETKTKFSALASAIADIGEENIAASNMEKNSSTETEIEIVPVPGAEYAEIDINLISPNLQQPRSIFDEDEINELATSIKEVGILQPVVVRKINISKIRQANERRDAALAIDAAAQGKDYNKVIKSSVQYEIIMGERRWRAARRAGIEAIPAVIRSTKDTDLLRDAIIENLHRANLNPLEEAAAYKQLLDDFDCSQEELSRRIARSRPQIANTMRLLKLPPQVQKRVAAGVISAGHARAILGLANQEQMEALASRIVQEGLSVRRVEEIVSVGETYKSNKSSRREYSARIDEDLQEIVNLLKDRLETTVSLTIGKRKGKITIGFADEEDIYRIFHALNIRSKD